MEPVVDSDLMHRWARRGLILILLAATFWVTAAPLRSYDVWWLIALGREILTSWSVPFEDRFSHTALGHPVEDFQRLSQVVYYLVYRIGDLEGLVVFRAGLFSLCAALLVRNARRRGASTTLAVVVVSMAIYGMLVRAHTRPQVLHYVVLALFTARLTDRLHGARVFWSLLPIQIVWANLHAGQAPLGIMLSGALVLHELLHAEPGERSRALLHGAALIGLLTGCLALTPLGFDFFRVLLDGAGYNVTEFQNNDWLPLTWELLRHPQGGSYYVLPVMALLGLAGVASRRREGPLFDLLMLLGFLVLTFRLRRATASFMIVAAPVAAQCLERWVGRARHERPWEIGRITAAALAMASMIGFASRASIQEPRFGVAWQLYPRDAARWILEHRPPREIFHPYHLGGYLIWTLHPHYPVFVDGRDHVFHSAGVALDYVKMYDSLEECERIVAQYGIQTVLATNSGNRVGPGQTTPVLTCLTTEDWAPVFHGPVVTIYVRRTPENEAFIARHAYRLVRPQLRLDYVDGIPREERPAFRAEVERLLDEAPDFAEAWLLKGRHLLLHERDLTGARDAFLRAYDLAPDLFAVYIALLEIAERSASFNQYEQVNDSLREYFSDRALEPILTRFEAARLRWAGGGGGGRDGGRGGGREEGPRAPPPPPVLWR